MATLKARRLTHIDGARGYLLLMMFLAHFSFTHWTPIIYLHHGSFSPVWDGEFFVLLSGFVCALAYQGAFAKGGAWACELAVLRRLRWVYIYQIVVAMLMVLLFWAALPIQLGSQSPEALGKTSFGGSIGHQLLQTLTFAEQPPYLDILILYMMLMLFIPVALILLSRRKFWAYWSILVGLWLVAHFRIDAAAFEAFQHSVFDPAGYFALRGFMNPLSYALIFYAGFYLGFRYKQVGHDEFIRSVLVPRMNLFLACLASIGAFALAELFRGPLGTPEAIFDPKRFQISPQGLIATAASAYAVYFLLASDSLPRPLSWIANLADWLFTLPVLVIVGQSSLFFYSLHTLGVFGSSYVIQVLGMQHDRPFILMTLAATAALLVALAYGKKRFLPTLP